MPPRELPGFYWDENAQRYFQIPPNGRIPGTAPPVLEQRAKELKRQARNSHFNQRRGVRDQSYANAKRQKPDSDEPEPSRHVASSVTSALLSSTVGSFAPPVHFRRILSERLARSALPSSSPLRLPNLPPRDVLLASNVTTAMDSIHFEQSDIDLVAVAGQRTAGLASAAEPLPRFEAPLLSLYNTSSPFQASTPIWSKQLSPSSPYVSAVRLQLLDPHKQTMMCVATGDDAMGRGSIFIRELSVRSISGGAKITSAAPGHNFNFQWTTGLPMDVCVTPGPGPRQIAVVDASSYNVLKATNASYKVARSVETSLSDALAVTALDAHVHLVGLRNGLIASIDDRDPSTHDLGTRGGHRTPAKPPPNPLGQSSSSISRICVVPGSSSEASSPYLVAGSMDGAVHLFDIRKRPRHTRWSADPLITFWPGDKDILFRARPTLTHDGRVTCCTCQDGVVRLWSTATGRLLRAAKIEAGAGEEGEVYEGNAARALPSVLVPPSGLFVGMGNSLLTSV